MYVYLFNVSNFKKKSTPVTHCHLQMEVQALGEQGRRGDTGAQGHCERWMHHPYQGVLV